MATPRKKSKARIIKALGFQGSSILPAHKGIMVQVQRGLTMGLSRQWM
uniref:Uncharacterized protein n=1 Tax=Arundo donax TaxID=35708 RepID=A0A0A9ENC2_ARUDO